MIYLYLIIVNIWGYNQMRLDKQYAKSKKRRIPEKNLFMIAIIGGSLGSIIGMYKYRHKTKHSTFVVGMPMILIVQIVLLYKFII